MSATKRAFLRDIGLLVGVPLLLVVGIGVAWRPWRYLDASGRIPYLHRDIFRSIQVDQGSIALGQPLPRATSLAGGLNDTVVALRPGSFAGAERIWVHQDMTGRVRMIEFDYAADAKFAAMLNDYFRSLGPPVRVVPPKDREGRAEAVWQDAQTQFELVQDPGRSGGTVFTRLIDRAP